ncbi:uncharacterized protein LOC143136115 [Alosa pseudoharengus]|uniref:uncharacterized protein LOC143136115 n=1 Tax=Alosa pseudoharengus TaxID=34774 RepID=UPI003F8CA582
MVQSHQGAVAQPTQTQHRHAINGSQMSVAQSTTRQPQSQITQTWCVQTNSHTNINVVPNGSVQPQTTVNNLNVNRASLSAVKQSQQSSCVTVNKQNVQNRSSLTCQAMAQLESFCLHYISNQDRYGQHTRRKRKKKVAQAYPPNSVNSELQNIQTKGRLSSEGPALQPMQNSLIPNGTNGQNVTLVSSPSSRLSSHDFGNDVNHRQISRRNVIGNSPTTSSTIASQCHYSNISTHSPPLSSDVQRLNPSYPYGPHSQSAPSQNMNVPSCSTDLPPSTTRDNSLSPPDNVTVSDLYNHHTPNLHNKPAVTLQDRNPLLLNLLVTKDTWNIDQSIECMGCHGSIIQGPPNKSVQTHRAVAVVPPISKQPGDGGKGKEWDDALPMNCAQQLRSLADDKEIKKAIVLPFDTDSAAVRKTSSCVKSAEVGCRPEADVTDESAVCHNLNSLNSLSPENKDTPNNEELCGPDVFFGMPIVTFSLKMVKILVIAMELKEEEERKKNESRMNKPEFADADAVLDLYWAGKCLNYTVAELDGTFENILKEAAKLDTKEDNMVFDVMDVENLNQLKQKGHILTNCFDCDIATELNKSSWRNVNDESLDIDRELADEDFTREICGSLLEHWNLKSQERHLLNSIQAPDTTSPHEDSVSKKDLCPSTPLPKDTVSLYNENCTAKAKQTKHVKPESQDDPRQKVTVSTTNNSDRRSVSKKENKEDDVSLQVSMSLRNLNRHSYKKSDAADTQKDTVFNILEMSEEQTSQQCLRIGSESTAVLKITNSSSQDSVDSGNNSRDLDHEMNVTEEGLKLSERLCEEVETSEKDYSVSPADTMLSIKLTALSSEKEDKVDSENVHQDLISSPHKAPPSPSNEHSYESPKSPDEPMLSMKITVLSMDEFKALSKELWVDSDDSVHSVALSSPICLDSEDDDLEVDLEHTCKTIGDLSQMMKQENITTFEEEIPSFPSIEQVLKLCEIQTGRTEKLNDNMDNSATKGPTSPLKDSSKEKDTLEHQLPSQNACRKGHALTTHQGAKSPGLEIHIPHSSSSRGIKASSPISPSAPIRTTNSDVMKESSSLEAERSSASNDHETSIPTSTLQSVTLKKCRTEPLENCENSKLTDVLCPSGHSPLKVTKKSNNSQKFVTDITKTPDKKRHIDNDVSLTNTSRENVLNLAGTSENPELPKSSGVHRKRKRVTFKLYGSQKVDSKEANGMDQYHTNCDRNLPPLLNILYSPDQTSARDKIRKCWGDSFVPTPKCRRLSSSEDKNREKNVPERPVNHYKLSKKDQEEQQRSPDNEHQSERKSSGKDKDKQQQRSSSKEHRSDHRKRKHRSFSLSELRREAERRNTSKKSLQEKQDMGLHVIKRYQQIHMKV